MITPIKNISIPDSRPSYSAHPIITQGYDPATSRPSYPGHYIGSSVKSYEPPSLPENDTSIIHSTVTNLINEIDSFDSVYLLPNNIGHMFATTGGTLKEIHLYNVGYTNIHPILDLRMVIYSVENGYPASEIYSSINTLSFDDVSTNKNDLTFYFNDYLVADAYCFILTYENVVAHHQLDIFYTFKVDGSPNYIEAEIGNFVLSRDGGITWSFTAPPQDLCLLFGIYFKNGL